MASGESATILRNLRAVFEAGPVAGLTDAQLLERLNSRPHDGIGFEALLARHGPMVLGVCRDMLRDDHAAEDAFQATFLVLVRKARTVRAGDSLGRWLSGVAWKVAVRARADARRRGRRLGPLNQDLAGAELDRDAFDLKAALHEELARLPGAFRTPIVLCHLEDLTHEEAAQRLGWPIGTVRSRLARGRERLRSRLARRGLAPAVGVSALAAPAPAAVPPKLATATLHTAVHDALGQTGAIPACVLALARGVITSMIVNKMKLAGMTALASGMLLIGIGPVRPAPAGNDDSPKASTAGPRRSPTADPPAGLAERPANARVLGERLEAQLALGDPPAPAPTTFPTAEDRVHLALVTPGTPPQELAARLRRARELAAMIDRLFRTGTVPTREAIDARFEVEILESQVADRIDQLEEDLELLRARLEMKQGEAEAAEARSEHAKVQLTNLYRRIAADAKLVSYEERRQAEAIVMERAGETKAKRAEVKETEIRIKHARRRLDQLKPLLRNPPDASNPALAQPKQTPPSAP